MAVAVFVSWMSLVLLITQQLISPVNSAKRLNDFIRHYEELSYNVEVIHHQHTRAKRSTNPQVDLRFESFNKIFRLRLVPDTTTFSDDAQFEYGGKLHAPSISHIYTGEVVGVPQSKAHGSIIEGVFSGSIVLPGETYHIEKSEVHFTEPQPFHSVIYRDSDVSDAHLRRKRSLDSIAGSSCGNSDSTISDWMRTVQDSAVPHSERKRRSEPEPLSAEQAWAHKYSEQAQQFYRKHPSGESRSRRATDIRLRKTCTLYLEADPMLWYYMTGDREDKNLGYPPDRAMEEITSLFATHVNGIKAIYEKTIFQYGNIGPYSGFSFVVRRVKINTDEDCQEPQQNSFCRPNIDVSNFLNWNSLRDHGLYCLAYVFTYRDFTGGTLGLAWVGSPTKASGGICEEYKEYTENNRRIQKSLNTGIVTLVNYGSRVPTKVSTLTFAHEVGHNFGSPHDGGSCVPTTTDPTDQEGNFIMFASATSGDRGNNNKFSSCSIGNMTLVLDAIMNQNNGKKNCLVESQEAFCGNALRETGEVCDCGFEADCNKTDLCCHPQEAGALKCTLKDNKECSPSQGPCCKSDCTKHRASEGHLCQNVTECSLTSYCNGTSAVCPQPEAKADLTPCNDFTQVCRSGICQGTICEKIGWKQCYMTDLTEDDKGDKGKLCFVACQAPNSVECVSTGDQSALNRPENEPLKDLLEKNGRVDIRLQPGAPCDNFKGYCDVFQKCRGVDADGPLARLKNLLLNQETLTTIRDWIVEYWWAVLLMGVALVVFMGLFIKVCAVHTPSSNPKKPPARKIGLKPQPSRSNRQQGPPPGYPAAQTRGAPHSRGAPVTRGGPPHGRGSHAGRPPPYNPHSAQSFEMSRANRV